MVLERFIPLPANLPKSIALEQGNSRFMRLHPAKARTVKVTAADRTSRDLAQLRETTGQVVGSVFYGTMLRAMRESALKGKYGHGGRGEEVFAGQLHGMLAERAGAATAGSIGEAVFERLSHQQQLISRGKFNAEV